jgi:nitroreductase
VKIYDAICGKRTIRLFQKKKVSYDILEKCINGARLSSSARNDQPLEYIVIDDEVMIKRILPFIHFGGFIPEDSKKGNEPAALIVIIVKKDANRYYQYDVGIAAQNISLGLYENGIGSCMMGAIDRERIHEELKVPANIFVDLVISLGYPNEKPVVEDNNSRTEYYREASILHIPKKTLSSIIHRNVF